MIKIKKIRLHASVFFFFFVMLLLGKVLAFFMLLLVTTLHELAHAAVAHRLGYRTERFIITPVGEVAHIEGFDWAPAADRLKIVLAGPMLNLLCAALAALPMFSPLEGAALFRRLSLTIGVFNLLPIYPMDGGRLLFVWLGNQIGILKSRRFVGGCTKTGIGVLLVAGLAQVVIQPFNMSLAAIAVFMCSIYRRERDAMYFSFLQCMLNKSAHLQAGRQVRAAVFFAESSIAEVQQVFTWNRYHLIYVMRQGRMADILTEDEIFAAGLEKGAGEALGVISRRKETAEATEKGGALCALRALKSQEAEKAPVAGSRETDCADGNAKGRLSPVRARLF